MVKKIKNAAAAFIIVFLTAAAPQAAEITDDVGRVIKLDLPVKKVVSLSPAQTEMVYFLGMEKKLAAVSTRCDYPEEAKNKLKAGTFMHPDIEKIAEISPDCVFSGGGVQKRAIKKLEELNIPVLVFYPRSLGGIKKDMETLAAVLGAGEKPAAKLKKFYEKLGSKRAPSGKKVYIELWGKPVMGVGGSSYINSLLKACGAVNIIGDAAGEYPRVSAEEIIKRDPEIIMLLYDAGEGFKKLKRFKNTTAGEKGDIYIIDKNKRDEILRPGPRIVEGMEIIKKIISGGVR